MTQEMTPAQKGVLANLEAVADRMREVIGLPVSGGLINTLKKTVFAGNKNPPTNEELLLVLTVASEYQLNPMTKEIYAFSKGGKVVPIVGIDGWLKIINRHPSFIGMTWETGKDDELGHWCECIIKRNDREYPITHREYLNEVKQSTDVWAKYPMRMLKHRATIQCARYAFNLSGIYDEDTAREIIYSNDEAVEIAVGSSEEKREWFIAETKGKTEAEIKSIWKDLQPDEREAIGIEARDEALANAVQEAEFSECENFQDLVAQGELEIEDTQND